MIRNIFTDVLKDNLSGSGQILFQVQQSLLHYAGMEENSMPKALMEQVERLEQHFPHFALLFHFLNELKAFIVESPSVNGSHLEGFIRQYQNRWKDTQQKASENLLRYLSLSGKDILLHSNSSAIHNLFRQMADRKMFPTVWQTASSPANEGFIQAEFLKNMGFNVHIFHEDAVSKFITNIDLTIFGADLLWDDTFLNKVGTLPLALISGHFHKPVYVLAESRKRINISAISEKRLGNFLDEQPKPPEEITKNTAHGIHVHNYYFETTPLSLVNSCFTDEYAG